MATLRKRGMKWQVQIRRKGQSPLSRSFTLKRDAEIWAREMERRADLRELPADLKLLDRYTLGDLVRRYRDMVTPHKRGGDYERVILTAFLRHRLSSKRPSDITTRDFAAYRDERLHHQAFVAQATTQSPAEPFQSRQARVGDSRSGEPSKQPQAANDQFET
jgi:hypothetical protein